MMKFLEGKKTYIAIAATALSMVTGINFEGGDVTIILNELQAIVAAVGSIGAVIGRRVAKV